MWLILGPNNPLVALMVTGSTANLGLAAEGAHAIALIPHVALAMLALATGYQAGVLWLLLPGIIMHFYPVLLQRWMTLRVAPLIRRPELH